MAERKSRSVYMRNYRELKKRQKLLEEESVNEAHDNCEQLEENSSNNDLSDTSSVISHTDLSDDERVTESDGGGSGVTSDSSADDIPVISSDSDSEAETYVSDCQQAETVAFLKNWAIKRQVTVDGLTELLCHFNHFMPSVPRSAATLKQSVGNIDLIKRCNGDYYYLSVKETLDLYLHDYPDATTISITVNVDGVQVFKSRPDSFWPILVTINGTGPYLVCLWYGVGKPSSADVYMRDFIDEMKVLQDVGHRNLPVTLDAFICDTPARDFLKCIVAFNSYDGCERCIVHGTYNRGVRLLAMDAPLRTNEEFANEAYSTHQHKLSPLVELRFPMITGFILDSMHMVFIGVVKKLLCNWISGSFGTSLSSAVKSDISAQLERMAPFIPSAFQRVSRSLETLPKWKATEYRFFLLYSGPIVLRGNLPIDEYNLFTTLSVAVHILECDNYCMERDKVMYAQQLLHNFVHECKRIYGDDFITFNIHSTIHIADDVLNHQKSLNALSAFPYESFLGRMVKTINGTKNPTKQAIKRYRERCMVLTQVTKGKQPFPKNSMCLPNKRNRVFYLGDNRFAIAFQADSENSVLCKVVLSRNDVYTSPLTSSDLSYCYTATIANCDVTVLQKDQLSRQAMMLPMVDGGFVFTPLIHTN